MSREESRAPVKRDIDEISKEQYDGYPISTNARRELYKYSRSGTDMWETELDYLDLDPTAIVIDNGTGDALTPRKLAARGHSGRILGFDLYADNFAITIDSLAADGYDNVELYQSDARDLKIHGVRLPDKCVDAVMSTGLLYHANDPMKILHEAHRVLKPGGQVLSGSRSTGNQSRLWGFAHDVIAPDVGCHAPESFYASFDIDATESAMEEVFGPIKKSFRQSEQLYIPAEGWVDYYLALMSLVPSFQPYPDTRLYRQSINERVKKVFDDEVASFGFFTEYVDQGFFICTKAA